MRLCATLCVVLAVGSAAPAHAQQPGDRTQQPADRAQQIYDSDMAVCNRGDLPDPMRRACVRAAGERLDRARGGVAPGGTAVTSPDGRATVVVPEGASLPPTSSEAVPSPDGRSTVVPAR